MTGASVFRHPQAPRFLGSVLPGHCPTAAPKTPCFRREILRGAMSEENVERSSQGFEHWRHGRVDDWIRPSTQTSSGTSGTTLCPTSPDRG